MTGVGPLWVGAEELGCGVAGFDTVAGATGVTGATVVTGADGEALLTAGDDERVWCV